MRRWILPLLILFCAAQVRAQDLTLKIPPVRTSFDVDGQRLSITAWGTVAGAATGDFRLAMTADLADLQDNITPLLSAQLNRSDRCGERLTVQRATLVPAPPAALLTVWVHYEKFGCAKAFGKEVVKRIVGGNGTAEVNLAPAVTNDGIALTAQVQKLDADGSLGEVLGSGALGDALREKIAAGIQSAVQKSANLRSVVPPEVAGAARLESVQFAQGDPGRLWLSVAGAVHIPAEQLRAFEKQIAR